MNVVGIDVGGARKGFHAVALSDGTYLSHCTTQDVGKVSDWCCETARSLALVTLALETLAVLVTRDLAPTLLNDRTHVALLWHIPAQPVNESREPAPHRP